MTIDHRVTTYADIGVRPFINCVGTITALSGSLSLPEVRQAMLEATSGYVKISELMDAVGRRIAEVMQCEYGLVTAGCAAALTQVTAACIAGTDSERIGKLPDTRGMRNEVIVQKSHRVGYDRAILAVGTRFVEVTSREELESAYTEDTAMVFIFGDAVDRGEISVKEMVESAHNHNVPVFVDAAAERPDVPNWYLEQGVDAVAYSGGKCLRGPQVSGLVLGREDLLKAAFANGCPNAAIGRPMKVGKEEIMGLLAAVEQWVRRDHQSEWKEWEKRLSVISDSLSEIDSVNTSIAQPGRSNVAPCLFVSWDPAVVGIDGSGLREKLETGQPRVEMSVGECQLSINPYMMEEGEDQQVAMRLKQIFSES